MNQSTTYVSPHYFFLFLFLLSGSSSTILGKQTEPNQCIKMHNKHYACFIGTYHNMEISIQEDLHSIYLNSEPQFKNRLKKNQITETMSGHYKKWLIFSSKPKTKIIKGKPVIPQGGKLAMLKAQYFENQVLHSEIQWKYFSMHKTKQNGQTPHVPLLVLQSIHHYYPTGKLQKSEQYLPLPNQQTMYKETTMLYNELGQPTQYIQKIIHLPSKKILSHINQTELAPKYQSK